MKNFAPKPQTFLSGGHPVPHFFLGNAYRLASGRGGEIFALFRTFCQNRQNRRKMGGIFGKGEFSARVSRGFDMFSYCVMLVIPPPLRPPVFGQKRGGG